MNRLGLRLAVNLAAASLIALSLVDVLFVFWAQSQHTRIRRLELQVAAAQAVRVLAAAPESVPGEAPLTRSRAIAQVSRIARQFDVQIWAEAYDGATLTAGPPATAAAPSPPSPAAASGEGGQRVQAGDGVEVVAWSVPGGRSPWRRLVASRRADASIGSVLHLNRYALLLLLLATAMSVVLGLFFLRRTVLRPLARLTELAGRGDRDALTRYAPHENEAIASLGRAIIHMDQQLADDSERLAAQLADLQCAHAELEATQEQLVRAGRLAVAGQLAAGLAHEIGNPVAVLSGYVELLQADAMANTDRQDALLRMRCELDRMATTVGALLDFARARRCGADSSSAVAADVCEVVEHVANLLRPQSRLRGVELDVSRVRAAHGAAPLRVAMDHDALTQVLLNLIFNAADAVEHRGTVALAVAAAPAADRMLVTVDDSGPGIPDDIAARIFEPFFSTKARGQGTGLGLAICERIVSSAGGDMNVGRSERLGGAQFTLSLPREPLAPDMVGARPVSQPRR